MSDSKHNVYLNGEFLPLEAARISVMDRGFLFGDGVYEVIPVYAGKLLRLREHLARLENSLAEIRMSNPLELGEWEQLLEKLTSQFPGKDQSVYLQVTRGPAEERNHNIPDAVTPTIFAMTSLMSAADPSVATQGIAAVTLDDIRWRLCNIKAITLLANVLLKQEAMDRKAAEAILVRDGWATEGAASNLFIVEGETISTPPKSRHLLPGITRDLVLELAQRARIPVCEEEIKEERLLAADEVWLTSSTREIMPVTQINGRPIGKGVPGPMFARLNRLYADYKEAIKRP
jgi:D-alanine transaminase